MQQKPERSSHQLPVAKHRVAARLILRRIATFHFLDKNQLENIAPLMEEALHSSIFLAHDVQELFRNINDLSRLFSAKGLHDLFISKR